MRKDKIVSTTVGITIFISVFLIFISLSSANDTIKAEDSLNRGYNAYKSHEFQKAIEYLEKSYQLVAYSKTSYYLSCSYFVLNSFEKANLYAVHALKDKPKLGGRYRENLNKIINWTKRTKEINDNSSELYVSVTSHADVMPSTLSPDPVETKFRLSNYVFYKIRNRWKDDQYLNIEHSKIECSKINLGWWSAQWIIEPIKGTNLSRIRNRWKDDQYLHIEHGKIECSKIHPGVWSAQWIIEPIKGTNLSRIRNRWKDDQYLHIEHGKIECSKIHPGVWSAQWILNPPLK